MEKRSLDRRTFVMGAAALGATAFAGGVLGGCVAEGPSTVEPASPEPAPEPLSYDSVFPPHAPLGRGVGAMPGRVAWVRDAAAVSWDGSGYWWERGHFDEAVIRRMVSDGVAATAGAGGAAAGWRALFEAHNARAGREGGYRAGQKIAVKANMNGAGTFGSDEDSSMSYTTPVLLRALLLSLVEDGGVAPGDITVYDVCRIVPGHVRELCSEGALSGVCFRYNDEGGGNDVVGDEAAPIVWSAEVAGDANVVPACVSEADYLIGLANLKGHSYGLTLSAKNHFGSLVNSSRLRPPEAAGIHRNVSGQTMGMYTVLVDLLANRLLGAKTMLWMLDGLVVATSEGATVTREAAFWGGRPSTAGSRRACSCRRIPWRSIRWAPTSSSTSRRSRRATPRSRATLAWRTTCTRPRSPTCHPRARPTWTARATLRGASACTSTGTMRRSASTAATAARPRALSFSVSCAEDAKRFLRISICLEANSRE